MAAALVQLFGGCARDGCFEGKANRMDLSVLVHEARGVDLNKNERILVSVREVWDRREGESCSPLGTACHLRSIDLGATLLLSVWACSEPQSARGHDGKQAVPLPQVGSGMEDFFRPCGELRIPLARLVTHTMLYQTWVTLDCPGLCDSMASVGLGGDYVALFDQMLARGAQQIFQPRICISVCRTADLSDGRLIFGENATEDEKNARWSALLRSQQQHEIMGAMQAVQRAPSVGISEASSELDEESNKRMQDVREKMQAQSREIERLKQALAEGKGKVDQWNLFQPEPRGSGERLSEVREMGPDGKPRGPTLVRKSGDASADSGRHNKELDELIQANAAREREVTKVGDKLKQVQSEANQKIEKANEWMRGLRRDRDQARSEVTRLQEELMHLELDTSEIQAEVTLLVEHKDNLMQIVEDINRECERGGLRVSDATRRSINSARSLASGMGGSPNHRR